MFPWVESTFGKRLFSGSEPIDVALFCSINGSLKAGSNIPSLNWKTIFPSALTALAVAGNVSFFVGETS